MGRENGFILTRQWQEETRGQQLVFWLVTDSGPARICINNAESVFFVATRDLRNVQRLLSRSVEWHSRGVNLQTFSGSEPVTACYFAGQRYLNVARKRLEDAGIKVFEADIRPTDRYLMERFVKGSLCIEGEPISKKGFQEYHDPKMTFADYQPELHVVSLDIETSFTENILYSIAVSDGAEKAVFMIGEGERAPHVVYVPDEKSALMSFFSWMEKHDPDVIVGWSVVAFDLWFLQQRCDALDVEFCIGRNREEVRWREAAQERRYALVPGRAVLDGIELLRSATYSFTSFSLENVARELLGKGKLIHDVDSRALEIQRLFQSDKPALAAYNLEDCDLVLEIFARTELTEFAIERSKLTGLDIDRMGGSVAAFDFLYLPALHREGYIAPIVDPDLVESSPGGFVLDSRPGLYSHVVVLDFKSLYPSIIRTFHVDPLALITAGEDAIPGYKGGRFSRERHLLPGIIASLWSARDNAKRLGQTANSQAIKIIMNSFYGVLGTTGCRFFDVRLASSITMRGHEILQKTRDLIEARGLTVIYGDTDSVFVLLGKGVSGSADANREGSDLAEYLNNWWKDYLRREYRLESALEVEFETHFEKFFMPTVRGSEVGSKKRYAGMVRTDDSVELVFKGLETVRSDWSQLAKKFQKELYRRVFLNEEYQSYIKATVNAVHRGELDDELTLRRRLRRRLDEYVKNVPPHVRAARLEEQKRRDESLPAETSFGGRWVEYLMTVNGPEPKKYLESAIDYQFYVDKQLAPIADAILHFEGETLAKLTDRQLGLF